MTDIKPCPWCGTAAFWSQRFGTVGCGSCCATGPCDTEERAVAAWNLIAEAIEALREWAACEEPDALLCKHRNRLAAAGCVLIAAEDARPPQQSPAGE